MPITGTLYNGQHSTGQECQLRVDDNLQLHFEAVSSDGVSLEMPEREDIDLKSIDPENINLESIDLESVTISSRVGNTPRTIYLPDGSLFKTRDNAALDALLKKKPRSFGFIDLHRWESSLGYIAVAAVILVVMLVGFFRVGLPYASEKIAHALPASTGELIADGSLKQMERFFPPTELDEAKQQHYRQLFDKLLPEQQEFNYQLHFRKSPYIGANAFALPDGTVVMTDELIELADSDEEVAAILLHEIAHVVHRHSMRGIIESTGIYAVLSWLTGDLEAVNSLIVAIPAILMQAKYSRGYETEADDYALQKMLEMNIDPIHFASIMEKLLASHGEKEQAGDALQENEEEGQETEYRILDYLSTHPAGSKRIKKFEDASKKSRTIP